MTGELDVHDTPAREARAAPAPEATLAPAAAPHALAGAGRATLARLNLGTRRDAALSLQRTIGNAATARRLLQRKEDPWKTDPKAYVLKAVTDKQGTMNPAKVKWTDEEKQSGAPERGRGAEIAGRLLLAYATSYFNETEWSVDLSMDGFEVVRTPTSQSSKPGGTKYELRAGYRYLDALHQYDVELAGKRLAAAFAAVDVRPTLEQTYGITITSYDCYWGPDDLADLRTALGLLTAAESERLRGWTIQRRTGAVPHGDADTDAATHRIRLSSQLFRQATVSSTGIKTATQQTYGRNFAVHQICHEFGHVMDFVDEARSGNLLDSWRPQFTRLQNAHRKISNQIKGDPAANPDFELLAEAFARFKTDPDGLRTDDAATFAFFAGGAHTRSRAATP